MRWWRKFRWWWEQRRWARAKADLSQAVPHIKAPGRTFTADHFWVAPKRKGMPKHAIAEDGVVCAVEVDEAGVYFLTDKQGRPLEWHRYGRPTSRKSCPRCRQLLSAVEQA